MYRYMHNINSIMYNTNSHNITDDYSNRLPTFWEFGRGHCSALRKSGQHELVTIDLEISLEQALLFHEHY
jgi:hypothetical protein